MNWLLIAEFEANSTKSSSTELEPFLATKSYLPRSSFEPLKPITGDSAQKRELKDADKLVAKLTQLKEYLRDELQ